MEEEPQDTDRERFTDADCGFPNVFDSGLILAEQVNKSYNLGGSAWLLQLSVSRERRNGSSFKLGQQYLVHALAILTPRVTEKVCDELMEISSIFVY